MLKSFAPFVDKKTTILVIGTMPGEASLQAGEYYAYKHNAFWKIISIAANSGQEFASYSQKLETLRHRNIGLWDNLYSCSREGSLDSNIKSECPNDFEKLLRTYPGITKLIFNGQKSFQFFKKYHKELLRQKAYEILPSTSPANASVPFGVKFEIWKKALNL